jgi:hypothetical protein
MVENLAVSVHSEDDCHPRTNLSPGAKASVAKIILKGGFGLIRRSGFKTLGRLTSYEDYCVDMMKRHIDADVPCIRPRPF